jgi:hypothetical protein
VPLYIIIGKLFQFRNFHMISHRTKKEIYIYEYISMSVYVHYVIIYIIICPFIMYGRRVCSFIILFIYIILYIYIIIYKLFSSGTFYDWPQNEKKSMYMCIYAPLQNERKHLYYILHSGTFFLCKLNM